MEEIWSFWNTSIQSWSNTHKLCVCVCAWLCFNVVPDIKVNLPWTWLGWNIIIYHQKMLKKETFCWRRKPDLLVPSTFDLPGRVKASFHPNFVCDLSNFISGQISNVAVLVFHLSLFCLKSDQLINLTINNHRANKQRVKTHQREYLQKKRKYIASTNLCTSHLRSILCKCT